LLNRSLKVGIEREPVLQKSSPRVHRHTLNTALLTSQNLQCVLQIRNELHALFSQETFCQAALSDCAYSKHINIKNRKTKHCCFVFLRIDKPDSVEGQSCIWDDCNQSPQATLSSGPIGSRRTRSCTQVGFLPLHLWSFHQSSSLRMPLLLSAGVSVRIPIPPRRDDGRYPLPSSMLAHGRVRTFLPVR
jgi:hypothetical protein